MRKCWLLAVPFLTWACATGPATGGAPAPDAAPAPAPTMPQAPSVIVGEPGGGFAAVENAQVGRAYLVGDEPYGPARDNLPFGVILLRRGDTARNQALCSSFVNNIATVEDIRAADASVNIIATYWLLRESLPARQLTDCDALLAGYDYGRAQRILAGYGKASAQGPVFLALQLGRERGVPASVFLLDLSRETPENVAQITINWFDVVVDRADDRAAAAASGDGASASAERGRGFFRRVLAAVGRVAGPLACDVLTGTNAGTQVAYTSVAFADPVLNEVRGTLQVVAHGNTLLSVASHFVGQLFCPPAATDAAARGDEAARRGPERLGAR